MLLECMDYQHLTKVRDHIRRILHQTADCICPSCRIVPSDTRSSRFRTLLSRSKVEVASSCTSPPGSKRPRTRSRSATTRSRVGSSTAPSSSLHTPSVASASTLDRTRLSRPPRGRRRARPTAMPAAAFATTTRARSTWKLLRAASPSVRQWTTNGLLTEQGRLMAMAMVLH